MLRTVPFPIQLLIQFLFTGYELQSPVKANLYAELDNTDNPKSVLETPAPIMSPITANIATHVSPKMSVQKKVRHRRVGSAGNGNQLIAYSQIPKSSPIRDRRSQSVPMEPRSVKLVDTETQTDLMDISADCTPSTGLAPSNLPICMGRSSPVSPSTKFSHNNTAITNYANADQQEEVLPPSPNNGNATEDTIDVGEATMTNSDLTYHDACSSPEDQLINDAMNSNERLDIRECSDDDNLERLGRKVTKFFNENRLSLQSDNGNSTTIVDGSLLYDVMSARRSLISVSGDEVTVISRSYSNGTVKAMNNYSDIKQKIMVNKLSDQDYYEDEGDDERYDDSWTDEEGEDTDHFSLRRKR